MKPIKESLITSTQYNDWKGTISLDDSYNDIAKHFERWIGDEHILGYKAYFFTEFEDITVQLSIFTGCVDRNDKGQRIDKKFPEVKVYKKEISIAEFCRLFKRIELKAFEDLGSKSMKLKIIEEIQM
ncbi:hypothetical protein ACG9HX_11085 [Acinetobacter ursingii]|uniref:hypothetical protein n=1 Tax=Acinetobacter ursingii TaxID=108980 RepID=UPI001957531E|nr:hypothetical protein [Acinetobacter ursingii]VTX86480.1 Uncharacterised protein [Acinetobacter ursingii]